MGVAGPTPAPLLAATVPAPHQAGTSASAAGPTPPLWTAATAPTTKSGVERRKERENPSPPRTRRGRGRRRKARRIREQLRMQRSDKPMNLEQNWDFSHCGLEFIIV